MAHLERINLSANGFYKTPDVGYTFKPNGVGEGLPFNYYKYPKNKWLKLIDSAFTIHNYGAACTEVEIDCLTGM